MNNNINYSAIMCQDKPLYIEAIVYHYIYGEMTITKIDRVKTKFEQFNYVVARINNRSTMSQAFVDKYGLTPTCSITFREDSIKDWLFINKDDVIIKDPLYANSIYEDKVRDISND